MFDEMISSLKKAKLPKNDVLRNRFNAAVIKKMAVLKMPHTFWQSDNKINPAIEHLFWAAIMLEDQDNFNLVEGLAFAECQEKVRLKDNSEDLPSMEEISAGPLKKLLDLAPEKSFRKILLEKIRKTIPEEMFQTLS